MTNLDVLSGFDAISVGVSYEVEGVAYAEYPADRADNSDLLSVFESRPGWNEDITGVRRFEDLPGAAQEYVEWVESLVGFPIVMLSVGPERAQVIPRSDLVPALT